MIRAVWSWMLKLPLSPQVLPHELRKVNCAGIAADEHDGVT